MTAKAYKGIGMEGSIAEWYAKTRRKDLEEVKSLARRISANLPADSKILEIAPGPGYLAIELAKLGHLEITGLDISKTFVEMARKNAASEGVSVEFRQGDAAHTPFADNSFDQLVCCAAFKNFTEPVLALKEMHRLLRPGARAFIIDLAKDAPPETIDAYIKNSGRSPLDAFLTKWTFRLMLLKRAYTRADFERFIAQSGFPTHEIRNSDIALEILLTK
jgi:ubiquinone/menaquinone biosynthesis C-methylase UbiE